MLKGWGGCWRALFSSGCCSSRVPGPAGATAGAGAEAGATSGPSGSTSLTLSSRLERGLEQRLVFVLCDPWAFGLSIPLSEGESSFRALNGHLDSCVPAGVSPALLLVSSLSLFLVAGQAAVMAGEVRAERRTLPTPCILRSFTDNLLKVSPLPRLSLLLTDPMGLLLMSS